MIPKVIHYIWLGKSEKPDLVKNCIASWEKTCPDYEIKEWNESNLDVNINEFVKEVIKAKKWAFAADFFRFWVLYNYGGIYLDTDVEVLKSFDDLLEHQAFIGFESSINKYYLQAAVVGAQINMPIFKELMLKYEDPPAQLIYSNGQVNFDATPIVLKKVLKEYGLKSNNERQTINGLQIYPCDFFCCKDSGNEKVLITKNSYSVHYFTGTWFNSDQKLVMDYKKRYGVFGKPLLFLTHPILGFRMLKRKLKRRKV